MNVEVVDRFSFFLHFLVFFFVLSSAVWCLYHSHQTQRTAAVFSFLFGYYLLYKCYLMAFFFIHSVYFYFFLGCFSLSQWHRSIFLANRHVLCVWHHLRMCIFFVVVVSSRYLLPLGVCVCITHISFIIYLAYGHEQPSEIKRKN